MTARWWPSLARPLALLRRRQAFAVAGASLSAGLVPAGLVPAGLASASAAESGPEQPRAAGDTLQPGQPQQPAPSGQRRWPSYFGRKSVWGYADRHSVKRGESFDLMLSTSPTIAGARGRVEFHRLGAGAPALVWTSPSVAVPSQRANVVASAVGPNWQPILSRVDTSAWPPGYYSADFIAEGGGRDPHVAQIIVRPPAPRGDILLKLSTNTYQAYNDWGGYSLYTGGRDDMARGAMVSFDRPSPPSFLEYEIFLARWLEEMGAREGFTVDYASNFDVHADPALLPAYRLVICGGHDEYWSKEEFDAFEARIFQQGRNTMFLCGNSAYWQVRYADINRPPGGADHGRQMVCYKSIRDPIARRPDATDPSLLITAQFREGNRRPESMLMGVAYQSWHSPGGNPLQRHAYTVAAPDHPLFEGTGLQAGERAADVVGYEWDNRDPYGNGARLWDKDRSRNAFLPPEKLQVLFRGYPVDVAGRRGLAEAVYFESDAGAKVFSAGTIRWAWGLGRPGFVQPGFVKFNENLVRRMLGRIA